MIGKGAGGFWVVEAEASNVFRCAPNYVSLLIGDYATFCKLIFYSGCTIRAWGGVVWPQSCEVWARPLCGWAMMTWALF
jgi:hypothetical protein